MPLDCILMAILKGKQLNTLTFLCVSCRVDIYLYVDSLLRSEYMLRFQDYVLGFCFKIGGSWWVAGNVLNLLPM